MSSSNLWVHVKGAQIESHDAEPSSVMVTLKVGKDSQSTGKALTPQPQWEEHIVFTIDSRGASELLIVELYKYKFLFRYELLGSTTVPVHSIRHSNKRGEGFWMPLFLPASTGDLLPTKHQIQLDAHFELPKDLPSDLVKALEEKLHTLDHVLEKEIEVIESQQHRLVTGQLSPPPVSPTPERSAKSSPGSGPAPRGVLSHTPSMQSSRRSPSIPSRHSSGRLSSSIPSQPFSSPDASDFDEYDGSGGDDMRIVRSRANSLDDCSSLELGDLTPQQKEARENWGRMFQKLLPSVRARVSQTSGEGGGLFGGSFTGNGASKLVELVDQLKGYKMLNKRMSVANIQSFSMVNNEFVTRSRNILDNKNDNMRRRRGMDEYMKMHVYKRTIEALLYPASEPDNHMFEKFSAHKPTMCSECNYILWGLMKQGVKCKRCGKICHERCSSLASQDCSIHDQESAISEKMHRMSMNHKHRFRLLREAFGVEEEEHATILQDTQAKILELARNFSAEVTVTVLAAQGLAVQKPGDSRIYVSVDVAQQKKRTKVFKGERSPQWEEEFTFSCYYYHELIKIRVWIERDSAAARVAQKLTKDGDTFLGEKTVEVRRVGPPQDVWYKLEKRTLDHDVSGYIKVRIAAKIEGDEVVIPFHDQYKKLHDQLFYDSHFNQSSKLVAIPPKPEDEGASGHAVRFLPGVAQEIVDEFGLRYGIEPIYRMMVHFELLVSHHSVKSALTVMGNLLKNLKYQMFIHIASDNSIRAVGATKLMEEYLDASNYGRDNFISLMDNLLTYLKLDLQQYREFYPVNDDSKLAELVETCQLMAIILEFQQQTMSILTSGTLEDLILENMKECLKGTFDFIVQNCVPPNNSGHPGLNTSVKPFQFFHQLLQQVQSVIYEDRTVYSPLISKFCPVNLGNVSAVELWEMFANTIADLFQDETNLYIFQPKDYLELFFLVKNFYDSVIGEQVPTRKDMVPEYPRWFLPCVRRWLEEFQKDGLFFINNAWEDDKNTLHFGYHVDDQTKFSSSTYQTFFYLYQGFDLINSLGEKDAEVRFLHLEYFAQVVCNMIQHYVDKVALYIPECINNPKMACMLLNNLQALRQNIEGLFAKMGGNENAGPGATQLLQGFQGEVLTKQLQSWCIFVARSLTPLIVKAIGQLQTKLIEYKGSGPLDRNSIKDDIVGPLLDVLFDRAKLIAVICEPTVTQKVIKELWYVVLESLHRMLLPMLKWDHEGVEMSFVEFPKYNYNTRQCSALDMMMDILKAFFTAAETYGVKQSTVNRGMKQLKGVISLYRETTEMLITDFIVDETSTEYSNLDATCGEVNLEVDAFLHPATGELEGTIRVISACNLKSYGSVTAQPYIELYLIQPHISSNKRKFSTHHKNGTAPVFNENFKFVLSNWENCELQVVAKHKSTFGKNKVYGMAVIPFSTLQKEASFSAILSNSLIISDRGMAILNVLSVRTADAIAKEFVALKMLKGSMHEMLTDS